MFLYRSRKRIFLSVSSVKDRYRFVNGWTVDRPRTNHSQETQASEGLTILHNKVSGGFPEKLII